MPRGASEGYHRPPGVAYHHGVQHRSLSDAPVRHSNPFTTSHVDCTMFIVCTSPPEMGLRVRSHIHTQTLSQVVFMAFICGLYI